MSPLVTNSLYVHLDNTGKGVRDERGGWLPFIPDPKEHGTAASIGHYLELDLSPASNAPLLLTAVLRIMQVQVQREDGFQDIRIYNGSCTRPSWLGSLRLVGKRDRGLSPVFPFFPLSLLTSYHTVRCLSVTKIPLGKDLQTRKSFPICSEMMFDLVSTKRHGQPGLRTDRTGKVHFTISSQISLDFWRNNFSPIHALARVYF